MSLCRFAAPSISPTAQDRRRLSGGLTALLLCASLLAGAHAGSAEEAATGNSSQATISADQQKLWTEAAAADRHGADQLWNFGKADYHATVLLTQADIGAVNLAAVIDKVLDQIDKQFSIKPAKSERQFAAANCMGFRVEYLATNHGSSRFQVQYFIPKNDRLYILTCSCKKGKELGIDFDAFADSFLPPARK